MTSDREHRMDEALNAIADSGETNSTVIGADSDFAARRKMSDALYLGQHKKGNQPKTNRIRIKTRVKF